MTLKELGKKVKKARKDCKITQRRLSEISGLNIATIRKIEQGVVSINFRNLTIIAIALKKRLVIFFDDI